MGSGHPEGPGDAIHRPPARRSGQEPVLFISAWCPGTAHLSPRLNKWGLPKMNKRLMSAWNWDFLNVLPLLWTLSVTELSSVVIKCTDVYQNTSNVRDFLFPLHFAVYSWSNTQRLCRMVSLYSATLPLWTLQQGWLPNSNGPFGKSLENSAPQPHSRLCVVFIRCDTHSQM